MATKIIQCTIKGTSPLLMHAYPMVPVNGMEKMSSEEQAEYSAYRDPETKLLYIPGVAIQRALVNGATYSKGKSRSSLQKPVAACVLITPERCSLGVNEYVIDARPVVIPATKGRVIRYRPRLETWQTEFLIEFDPVLLKEDELRKVVDDTGSRVGLLDFRPACKGPYGRFMVVNWEC